MKPKHRARMPPPANRAPRCRSAAQPYAGWRPNFARWLMIVVFRKLFQLVGRRFALIKLLPRVVRHAVDHFARRRIAQRHALFLGGGAVPFRQTVAAKARQVHQVEILHVGALLQMRDQTPERGGLELDSGLVVHAVPPFPLPSFDGSPTHFKGYSPATGSAIRCSSTRSRH